MVLLGAVPRPRARWFKYAGNWHPDGPESPSYTFQRWWLTQGWHRGLVTVNGEWPDQPGWVRTFFNPSLTDADLECGREIARAKSLGTPLRLVFVGRLESPKGAGRAIDIVAMLRARGVEATLELVGNGIERAAFERRVADLGLASNVRFLGWLPPAGVQDAFSRAHVQLLPTKASEGWPKALSEGMAFGVVPVAGSVSSIPQYLATFRTGSALPPEDLDAFASALARYASHPEQWADESRRAVEAAHLFSFRHYLSAVDQLLADLPR
jgi:glycosyltransferase involved in cell wall biosynthesis